MCAGHVGPAKVICFKPNPPTTQGEAEDASRIARNYGWTSMVLVTTEDQVWRAHLRFQRCFCGQIDDVAAPIPGTAGPTRSFISGRGQSRRKSTSEVVSISIAIHWYIIICTFRGQATYGGIFRWW